MTGVAGHRSLAICQQKEVCWVCLEEEVPGKPLTCPCPCPRPVHPACLARWQLHSAGSTEEVQCRFCQHKLPDWKKVLAPSCSSLDAAMPTMSVTFNGQIHHVLVRGGPGGYEAFVNDIRQMFGITEELDMHLAFDCADPLSGQLVKLNGSGAFQAAVHCATISAAKRMRSTGTPAPSTRETPARLSQEAPTRIQPPRRASSARRRRSGCESSANAAAPSAPAANPDALLAEFQAMHTAGVQASRPLLDCLHQPASPVGVGVPSEAELAALCGRALDAPAKRDLLQAWLDRVRATLTDAGGAAMAATALATSLTDPTTAQLVALQIRLQSMLAELPTGVTNP